MIFEARISIHFRLLDCGCEQLRKSLLGSTSIQGYKEFYQDRHLRNLLQHTASNLSLQAF